MVVSFKQASIWCVFLELGFLVETHMIVSEVVEGQAADKNGGLQPGDHIMQAS